MGQNHREASPSEYHVLAVDDSPVDRKIIERLLGNSSYKVTSVDCVRKALEFLGLEDDCEGLNVDKIKVNMIVTDYNMPGLTGYDLLRRVKESSALMDIPVVIMSSENEESRTRRYLSGGAEEFILKPVRSSDVERLRSHILKRQPSSSSNKRKYMSDSILVQAERRPRLSGLTVA